SPSLTIVVFVRMRAFLAFYHLGSCLVQSRIRPLSDEARFIARSTALEIQRAGGRDVTAIVSGRQANAGQQFPGMSLAVVPFNRPCAQTGCDTTATAAPLAAVGPWAHTDPPLPIPSWIDCAGFGGP